MALVLGIVWTPAWSRTVEGHRYDEQLSIEGKPVMLNGAGVRQFGWFKGFTVGLWVGQRSTDAERLMQQDSPKRLRMVLLVDKLIGSEEVAKALHDGVLKRVDEAEVERLTPRLDALTAQVLGMGKITENDTIDLDYLPQRGVQLRLNGQPKGAPIPGPDLFEAILSIYIGERPVDRKLKPALLGAQGD